MVFGKNRAASATSEEDGVPSEQFQDAAFVDPVDEENNQNADELSENVKQPHSEGTKTLDDKPLYDEVNLISAGNSKNAGGSKVWVCKHCKGKFTSSSTRIHAHFFAAAVGKKAEIKRCPVVMNYRDTYERLRKKVKAAETAGVSKSLKSYMVRKKILSSNKPMELCFAIMERSAVDLKIVRAFCANGIPFNILRNPQFREMINAIKKAPEGYKAPSSEKQEPFLLDECVRDVEKDLTPFKDTWYTQGISIVSDGWSNIKHKPLINILAVNSCGAMFLYAEDFSGVEKTGAAIAEFLSQAIESVGPSNVLSVVTDNAVHTLNLIFKDFANEFCWLEDTYKKGKMIVKYFLNHGQALSIFRENLKLELLKVAKTRFASHYIMLKRLINCKEALSTTISLNSWRVGQSKAMNTLDKLDSLLLTL